MFKESAFNSKNKTSLMPPYHYQFSAFEMSQMALYKFNYYYRFD